MADLSSNSLWATISSGGDVATDILGPDYSYADNIPGPGALGVGSDGSFGQVFTNVGAAGTYVKTMITGDPPLGNQFYVNTGGSCTAPDGSIQARWNYVDNIPGTSAGPGALQDLSFLTSDLDGLIPGIVSDIEGLDPLYLFSALTADGTPACSCYTCPVTTGNASYFMTPELSPDFNSNCQLVDPSNCNPAPPESFTNYGNFNYIPTLVAFIGLLFLVKK